MTRWFSILILLGVLPMTLAADVKGRIVTFVMDDAGKLPKGWSAGQTGEGAGSVWKVVADDTAPSKKGFALAQTAEGPKALFNLCLLDDTSCQNLQASVSFKAVKGKVDQGGGLVWRYQDPNNYYVARYNPLEQNLRLYKVVNGTRRQLATKDEFPVQANEWHTLQIAMEGDKIECKLDGKPVFEASDDAFPKAGKVGLWTKADAQTYFDDLKISGK